MMPYSIFHVDDDPLILSEVERAIQVGGHQSAYRNFREPASFLAAFREDAPDVCLIDIHFKGGDEGYELIKYVLKHSPETTVVVLSYDPGAIRRSIALGAHDFFLKENFDADELMIRLEIGRRIHHGGRAIPEPTRGKSVGSVLEGISKRVPRILGSAISAVHVFGETGTGKEVVADLFKTHLPPGVSFVAVNCAAIAKSLVERELFGHAAGSFTDAKESKMGYLESASGGWLFLDEVDSLAPEAQAALLRALDNQQITRIGEQKSRSIDIRIISASNRNVGALVADGLFRQDLWQRLQETVIVLPPLRERQGEIAALIEHFLRIERGGPYKMSAEARAYLGSLEWAQGNIRELRNCIRAMTENRVGNQLSVHNIPGRYMGHQVDAVQQHDKTAFDFTLTLADIERQSYQAVCDQMLVQLIDFLKQVFPDATNARLAKLLGMPRSTLLTKIKKISQVQSRS